MRKNDFWTRQAALHAGDVELLSEECQMNKREVLAARTFGQPIAEDEADDLESYFVETDQWRRVFSGEIDIVYGPKGSGKSALYSLLRKKHEDLLKRGIIPAAGENIRGTPVFADLVSDPPASEEEFRTLWKLYFLSLIGTAFATLEFQNAQSRSVIASLEGAGLVIREGWSLRRMLRAALDYARRIETVGTEVKLNTVGQPEGLEAKITLREPSAEQRKVGYVSADTLLETADQALNAEGKKLWILLDRLDIAFAESGKLERNALRALFRVYRDMAALNHFALKIFIRDDIWARITAEGFREASHIRRSITITWTPASLLHLMIRRALHNEAICNFYKVDRAAVLADAQEQQKLFYRMFPAQVDAGARKSTTLDWMLTRTADGTRQTAPREFIHLLNAARDQELKLLEMGAPDPPDEALFDRAAIKAALPEVSKVRLEQTLCAEYPTLKSLLVRLEGERTQQTPSTLAKLWAVSQQQAVANAEKLAEVGFFEKRGTKEEPLYWVPFLYRDSLNMVQGPAD